jgi:hypothetical protein
MVGVLTTSATVTHLKTLIRSLVGTLGVSGALRQHVAIGRAGLLLLDGMVRKHATHTTTGALSFLGVLTTIHQGTLKTLVVTAILSLTGFLSTLFQEGHYQPVEPTIPEDGYAAVDPGDDSGGYDPANPSGGSGGYIPL